MSESYSVVIPAYNAEATLEACLSSVAAQTLAPLQVAVIDDQSSDGTQSVVERCARRFAQAGIQLEYVRLSRNAGPSAARNRGISEAKGKFIAFLDADDVWDPRKLEIVDQFLSRSEAGLIFHPYAEASSLPATSVPEMFEAQRLFPLSMLLRNRAQTSSVVALKQPELFFNESMRYCEDYDLWMKIAEHSTVVRLIGPPLTRLGRPQLAKGGLSGNTAGMRVGQVQVFYNFCRRKWLRRIWFFPTLVLYSLLKHVVSAIRRRA